jgi:hypothetical protein
MALRSYTFADTADVNSATLAFGSWPPLADVNIYDVEVYFKIASKGHGPAPGGVLNNSAVNAEQQSIMAQVHHVFEVKSSSRNEILCCFQIFDRSRT